MSTPGVSPEHIALPPHLIDAYYDEIFHTATPETTYFPYNDRFGLAARISIDEVRLADGDMEMYKFSMCRLPYLGQHVLAFSVCNVVDRQRHPLLYPTRILERAVPLLESTGPVDAVLGYWLAPPAVSVNYDEYMLNLKRLATGRAPTEASRAAAAQGTWTGRQLSRLGYSAVQGVRINTYGNVRAFFVRP